MSIILFLAELNKTLKVESDFYVRQQKRRKLNTVQAEKKILRMKAIANFKKSTELQSRQCRVADLWSNITANLSQRSKGEN